MCGPDRSLHGVRRADPFLKNGQDQWPLHTGQDFLPNHMVDGIDYASLHLWPDNWARTDEYFGRCARQLRTLVASHAQSHTRLNSCACKTTVHAELPYAICKFQLLRKVVLCCSIMQPKPE